MKKLTLYLILFVLINLQCTQSQSIQERMGYSKDTKLLIIHADDLGVSHAENMASIKAMENGSVTSASILVPCPWFMEIANYAKNHPQSDFGIHLAITSEWDEFKWGSVLGIKMVPSLTTGAGYFYDGRTELPASISANEVGLEIKAQIEMALKAGVQPTHLDAHMRAILTRPDFALEFLKVARAYHLPIASTPQVFKELLPNEDVSDVVFSQRKLTANPADFDGGMVKFYEKTLRSLPAGLSELVIHTAYDSEEMQAVTKSYDYWGSVWRQQDFDFFTSEQCRKILKEEKIQLITWREVKDKLVKARD